MGLDREGVGQGEKKNNESKKADKAADSGTVERIFLLKVLREFREAQKRVLAPMGGSALSGDILLFVLEKALGGETVSISQIYHGLDQSRTTVIKSIQSLAEDGLLRVEKDKEDGRRNLVYVSSIHRDQVMAALDKVVANWHEELNKGKD